MDAVAIDHLVDAEGSHAPAAALRCSDRAAGRARRAGGQPDAALLRAVGKLASAERELEDACNDEPSTAANADRDRWDLKVAAIQARNEHVLRSIGRLPATSMAGVHAKVRALMSCQDKGRDGQPLRTGFAELDILFGLFGDLERLVKRDGALLTEAQEGMHLASARSPSPVLFAPRGLPSGGLLVALAAFVELNERELRQFAEAAGLVLARRSRPVRMGDGSTRSPANSPLFLAPREERPDCRAECPSDEVLRAALVQARAAWQEVVEMGRREPALADAVGYARWRHERERPLRAADDAFRVLERTPAASVAGAAIKLRAYIFRSGAGGGRMTGFPSEERLLKRLARELERLAGDCDRAPEAGIPRGTRGLPGAAAAAGLPS